MTKIKSVRAAALITIQVAAVFLLFQPSAGLISWTGPERLTYNPDVDLLAFPIEYVPGVHILVWESIKAGAVYPDIYYKIRAAFGWSPDFQLTSDPAQDLSPTLVKLANGTVLVLWSTNRLGNYDIYTASYNGTHWSAQRPLVTNSADDSSPAAIVDRSGTLWLVFMRNSDIYYMTNKDGKWSSEARITNHPNSDRNPSVMVAKDGRIWVVWDSPRATSVDTDIYARIFNAGTWGPEVRLTTSADFDWHPAVAQDRDGTIWLFWSRDVPVTGQVFQTELFYKTSIDNGLTWSGEGRLTFDSNPAEPVEDDFPQVIQSSDKRLWLFFESSRDGSLEIYLQKSTEIFTHDVGVTRASLSSARVVDGDPVTISIEVKNLGDWNEVPSFQVRVNTTSIWSENLSLASGQSIQRSMVWDSSGSGGKTLPITAVVSVVAGETYGNSLDNTVVVNVCVLYKGDVNKDGVVNVLDLILVGARFGSKLGDPNYDPAFDINKDGFINILDLVIVAGVFGKRAC